MPLAILVAFIAAVLVVAIVAGASAFWQAHRATQRRVDSLQASVTRLREVLDDMLIGHVHEAQLKRVLSRVLADEDVDQERK